MNILNFIIDFWLLNSCITKALKSLKWCKQLTKLTYLIKCFPSWTQQIDTISSNNNLCISRHTLQPFMYKCMSIIHSEYTLSNYLDKFHFIRLHSYLIKSIVCSFYINRIKEMNINLILIWVPHHMGAVFILYSFFPLCVS